MPCTGKVHGIFCSLWIYISRNTPFSGFLGFTNSALVYGRETKSQYWAVGVVVII